MNPLPIKLLPGRITALRQKLFAHGLDAALISKKESIFYYSGLIPQHPTEREAYLLISPNNTLLYHSPFIDVPPIIPKLPMSAVNPLSKIMTSFYSHAASIGIEKTNLTLAEFERAQNFLPQINFETIDPLIGNQRLIKDSHEQKALKKAGKIAATTIRWCRHLLNQTDSVGITEAQIAIEIDHKLKQLGADEPAFPTIVAFDANSAKPHHLPNQTKLKSDSIVLIDMGASVGQYKSDLTRTWQLGSVADSQFVRIKSAVLSAYRQALIAINQSPNVCANIVDSTTRSVISQAGFGDKFIHSTGHGIGLEAHELPHLNPTDTTPIKPGTTFTIEPGIYLPHKFGYRHENTFIMTQSTAFATTL